MSDEEQRTEDAEYIDYEESDDKMQESDDNTQKQFNEAVLASMTKMSTAIEALEHVVSKQGSSTRGNTSPTKANKQSKLKNGQSKLSNEKRGENSPAELTNAEGAQIDTNVDEDVSALLKENNFTNEFDEEVDSEHDDNENDGDQFLETIKQELYSQNDRGPKINEKLADIANNRWTEKQEKEIVNERAKKYKVPQNCEKVIVPRVNDEIWLKMPSNSRGNDCRLASIEKCVTASTAAILECANDLLNAKKSKAKFNPDKMIVKLTDAVSFLGHVNHELVDKRRKAIKPHLKEEYRPLCSSNIPMGKLMFGDDLAKELRNAKEMSQCSNRVQNYSTFRPYTRRSSGRFHPFLGNRGRGKQHQRGMNPKNQRSSFKKQWRS